MCLRFRSPLGGCRQSPEEPPGFGKQIPAVTQPCAVRRSAKLHDGPVSRRGSFVALRLICDGAGDHFADVQRTWCHRARPFEALTREHKVIEIVTRSRRYRTQLGVGSARRELYVAIRWNMPPAGIEPAHAV